MSKPWAHPTLGEFEAGRRGWLRTVDVPAFTAFSYDTGRGNARRSDGKYPLYLLWFIGEAPDAPTPGMVAVAERVLAEPAALVKTTAAALWDDFNGRGPDSGMGWRGNLAALKPWFKQKGLRLPKRPEDLLPAMQLTGINVCSEIFEYDKPVADLSFRAAFEPEHGLSVLTDGKQILGTGFMNDVRPWKHLRQPKRQEGTFPLLFPARPTK